MRDQIKNIEKSYPEELQSAHDLQILDQIRVKYLGRKSGVLTLLLKQIGSLSLEEKKEYGPKINTLKKQLTRALTSKQEILEHAASCHKEHFDVTLPGVPCDVGGFHPITQVMNDIIQIFRTMGFSMATGPEIENDYYNFEALNIPAEHPARDMHDTFYTHDGRLLRTHTSPVQIRVMERQPPPIRIIAPGKVYRKDADISHTPMFHQVEGLLVDEGINMAHLLSVLDQFCKAIFDQNTKNTKNTKNVKTRFRPSFFSFTEPSVETDISCVLCSGAGCRVCKDTGWIEILGAGMVDPEVFRCVNIDAEKYTGFAFGMGVERIAMIKYGIDDIRLFFENDVRFLKQF